MNYKQILKLKKRFEIDLKKLKTTCVIIKYVCIIVSYNLKILHAVVS